MKLTLITPSKALNKVYLKQSVKREQIELFRTNLARLFERVRSDESEEHLKNIVADFLKDAWYKPVYEINTSGRADLVIHNGRSSSDAVGVIIEVKRPSNAAEMISSERPNVKALHELLHYYMQERFLRDNKEIRHLIICNIYEWYIFDAVDFERFFFGNQKFVKSYREWKEGTLPGMGTDWFYQEIARPFIEEKLAELSCTCFNLKEYERILRKKKSEEPSETAEDGGDRKLIALYKLLSPPHLLKLPFANDSNSLNREFYAELLHIIGLEEIKEKGKKLIRRKAVGARHDGSFLENTISVLNSQRVLENLDHPEQFGATGEEQLFSIGLELCITWLNRVLFLKLLEGRLIAHHRGDRSRAFLNSRQIGSFDDLQELFFEVLAVRPGERSTEVAGRYGAIPYLNSSLFEPADLERKTIHISALKERRDMPVHGSTVLKESHGKRLTGNKSVLPYLFQFLDAYDFATEGNAEIQEENKTIISAAVLGLIFEKINGYRDGSFFTPGFITMYICRESIRRAVVAKFRKSGVPGLAQTTDFNDLKDRLDPTDREVRKRANDIINSLRLCDPAVGSGHFLVSALNEIIALKSELGILSYRDNGNRVKEYRLSVEQDELIVIDKDDDHLFEYVLNRNSRPDEERQRLQETLFHEKQTIIENCLFGVDINPKSVSICRLRLWIELLKHAYYTVESRYADLETLPNIDINIKCGNSLVSRFSFHDDRETLSRYAPAERQQLRNLTARYREKVWAYKLGSDGPSNKMIIRREIDSLKEQWNNFSDPADGFMRELRRVRNELAQEIFVFDSTGMTRRQELHRKAEELERKIEERQRTVYANAFEWRFEFPEVLDDDGRFVGFDLVIGNPPYIRQEAIKGQKEIYAERFGSFFCGTADLYTYFYQAGLELLQPEGSLCYIAPNKFMRAGYGRNTRHLLTTHATPRLILDFGDLPIFDEATTYPAIVLVDKAPPPQPSAAGGGRKGNSSPQRGEGGRGELLVATFTDPDQLKNLAATVAAVSFSMPISALSPDGWTLERPEVLTLMAKLRNAGTPLGKYVNDRFYYGIKTGLNEAFVIGEETRQRLIAEDPKSAELIKPWLRGRDIRKWRAEWAGLYVIFTRHGTDIDSYPAIKRHLEQYRADLEPKKTGKEDLGRKPGPYKWFEIQDNIAYFPEFETAKIVYPDIAQEPKFLWEETGAYLSNTTYFIPTDETWLVGLLNSRLIWWLYGNLSTFIQGGFVRYFSQYMEQLPIPPATDDQKESIVERVEKILAAKRPPTNPLLSQEGGQKSPLLDREGPEVVDIPTLEAEIDRLVYALYGLSEEEIAVVEGRESTP